MRVEESITIGELSRRSALVFSQRHPAQAAGGGYMGPVTSAHLGSSVARANSASPRPRCARSCLLAVLRRRHAVRSARSRLTI
jgi:hypothetical protein